MCPCWLFTLVAADMEARGILTFLNSGGILRLNGVGVILQSAISQGFALLLTAKFLLWILLAAPLVMLLVTPYLAAPGVIRTGSGSRCPSSRT